MAWNRPKSWIVGDVGTASDLNLYVRDNLNYLHGDTAWTAPAFTANWFNYLQGYAPVGYRKVGDSVCLRGLIANNTNANWGVGAAAFTLAAGYRPAYTQIFGPLAYIAGGYKFARIDVYSSGVFSIASSDGTAPTATAQFVTLDTVEFSIIQ